MSKIPRFVSKILERDLPPRPALSGMRLSLCFGVGPQYLTHHLNHLRHAQVSIVSGGLNSKNSPRGMLCLADRAINKEELLDFCWRYRILRVESYCLANVQPRRANLASKGILESWKETTHPRFGLPGRQRPVMLHWALVNAVSEALIPVIVALAQLPDAGPAVLISTHEHDERSEIHLDLQEFVRIAPN